MTHSRTRTDRCPGVQRPWPAADGMLVRLRLVGGRVSTPALRALIDVAEEYADGRVRLTRRANLQVRGLPGADGALDAAVVAAIERTGLLPSRTHELVRNVMVSPQTGLAGGRADLRPVAAELDERLRADPRLADLPSRFLFALDDGRGDLVGRDADLGLVALDGGSAQLRVGGGWGPVVALEQAPGALLAVARDFLTARGEGPGAAWHIAELTTSLPTSLAARTAPDPRLPDPAPPLPLGAVPGGWHHDAAAGIDRMTVRALVGAQVPEVVVTPWRGVLVPTPAGGGSR